MKKLLLILCTVIVTSAFTFNLISDVDDERMKKDLEIAKNILSTLFQTETDKYFSSKSIEATYVQDYGVIFIIPESATHFHFNFSGGEGMVIHSEDGKFVFEDGKNNYTIKAPKDVKDKEKSKDKSKDKTKIKDKDDQVIIVDPSVEVRISDQKEITTQQKTSAALEKIYISFLADYADVIGQLKPEHRIVINQQGKNSKHSARWYSSSGKNVVIEPSSFSVEAKKKDITDYKTGDIDFEEFKNRLSIKRNVPTSKVADLEIFASVFKQFFSKDLSKTYFTEGTPKYELLEGFGAIYAVRLYSSYQKSDKMYYMPTLEDKTVTSEQRREIIVELYPQFVEDLKSFIIDYGRTIRSLEKDEMLMMKIQMTRCKGCDVPEEVEATVKMSVLQQYDQQKISREKAISQVNIKG